MLEDDLLDPLRLFLSGLRDTVIIDRREFPCFFFQLGDPVFY